METSTSVRLPKVAIEFCVKCKWNLRAAYYAQELLSSFSDDLGEVSLLPVTGGIFTITLYHKVASEESPEQHSIGTELIWDRKRDGGFPETKELKNRVRNVIDPGRDMGHVDRALKKGQQGQKDQDGQVEEKRRETEAAIAHPHEAHSESVQSVADCEECRDAANTG